MGGVRCLFRHCNVTTGDYPEVHFFRFPVADTERFAQWIEMTGARNILKLSVEAQKCKLVCGRHFRDECFMNFKMDRLVRGKAVPTIMRINKTKAYDYEQLDEDGNPKLVDLEPSKMSHLIPPPGFPCPFAFTESDEKYLTTFSSSNSNNQKEETTNGKDSDEESTGDRLDETVKIFLQMDNDEEQSEEIEKTSKRRLKHESDKKPKSKIRKIVKSSKEPAESSTSTKMASKFLIKSSRKESPAKEIIPNNDELYESIADEIISDDIIVEPLEVEGSDSEVDGSEFVNKNLYDEMVQHFEIMIEDERSKSNAEIERLKKENGNLLKDLFKARLTIGKVTDHSNKSKTLISQMKKINEDLTRKLESSRVAEDLTDKTIDLERQIESLQNDVKELEAIKKENAEISRKSAECMRKYSDLKAKNKILQDRVQNNTNNVATTSSTSNVGTLTKAQLFLGIKKYLNSSMIALLRMQMFGDSEREWKHDEKQVAKDLLSLGEDVYKNFADEWRFHLPSRNLVSKWLQEPIDDDMEDL